MHLRKRQLAALVSVFVLCTACGGGSGGDDATGDNAQRGPEASASPEVPPPVDPPHGFRKKGKQVGTAGHAFMKKEHAYHVFGDAVVSMSTDSKDDQAVRVRGLDGQRRAAFTIDSLSHIAYPYGVATKDEQLVLTAVSERIEGTGTEKDRDSLVVTARDAMTGKKEWTTAIKETAERELPPLDDGSVSFVDANAKTILLSAEPKPNFDEEVTFALDTDDGDLRWTRQSFSAVGLDEDTVIGYQYSSYYPHMVGLSAKDQRELWSGRETERYPGGTVLDGGLAALADSAGTYLMDTGTGKTKAELDAMAECHFDQKSTVICGAAEAELLVGYDADSMERLWELSGDDAQREVPELVAARPGVVYVNTSDGPVTLEARTGEDLDTDLPDISLVDVVEGYGIVVPESGSGEPVSVYAHRGTA
ncbi:PQQ-binding-like beta-propeller repeat protein [Streptomyces sp. WMMB303]|uniref:outer membrane protein assembly factor BamB family protein n=1 Tax=Streptomyces sp. WMMB303 TaxID=3034154 RepID=UPI0023EAF55A|nr:PQQ-binding-like beta-propeller repeat protein [Streptomyces sp. WMMB303]MDF4254643.1 hypothetical protein [Streptomyces sp. WMMB303]